MKRAAVLLTVALILVVSAGLVACGGGTDVAGEPSTSTEGTGQATQEATEITGPADVEGTWTGTWYNMFTMTAGEPEPWAEGSIQINADGTYVSNFTPVTDEPPVEISETYTLDTSGETPTLTIHGRPYYAEITGDTLTLTEFSDDGTASEYPTFVLKR